MSLHPDVIDALVAAGATALMIAAACRAAWEVDNGTTLSRQCPAPAMDATVDATHATLHPVASTRSSTQRSRDFRAKRRAATLQQAAVACNVAPVAPPPLFSSLEDKFSPSHGTARASPLLVSMSQSWQPLPSDAAMATGTLGEASALNSTAKFRDHWEAESGPRGLRSPTQWDAAYRKWIRAERDYMLGTQRNLPLMQNLKGGSPNGRRSHTAVGAELVAERRAQEADAARTVTMARGTGGSAGDVPPESRGSVEILTPAPVRRDGAGDEARWVMAPRSG